MVSDLSSATEPEVLDLSVLDALVLDTLQTKPLKACKLTAIRQRLEDGQVEAGMALLEDVCPQVLQDPRYVFRLVKLKFGEKCSEGADAEALKIARHELAPLALDAYPEAYIEFKKAMQKLLIGRRNAVSELCSTAVDRKDLASSLYQAVWDTLGLEEPVLLPMLSYLLYIHSLSQGASTRRPSEPVRARQSVAERQTGTQENRQTAQPQQQSQRARQQQPLPELNLADLLLPKPLVRDTPPLPPDSVQEASAVPPAARPPFSSLASALALTDRGADVQTLIQCTGSTRREAMDALKRAAARGEAASLQVAFRSELRRLRLDLSLLSDLLSEYVAFRGLEAEVDGERDGRFMMDVITSYGASSRATRDGAEGTPGSSLMATDGGARHRPPNWCSNGEIAGPENQRSTSWLSGDSSDEVGRAEAGVNAVPLSAGKEQPLEVESSLSGSSSGASAGDATAGAAGSWSVRRHLQALEPFRSRSQSPPGKVQRGEEGVIGENRMQFLQAQLSQLNQLVKVGNIQEIERLVADIDSHYFDVHPDILFSLRRCRFSQILAEGDSTGALLYARTGLTPLAEKDPSLQPLLKGVTALILQPVTEDRVREQIASQLQSVSLSIQTALKARAGIQTPRLIKLLQALLGSYRTWLHREKFADPFAASLKLDALRLGGAPPPQSAIATTHRPVDNGDGGGGVRMEQDVTYSDSEGDDDDSDGSSGSGGSVDEDGLLRIMEILELPRSTAIDLLTHHDGDVEAAIMSAFS